VFRPIGALVFGWIGDTIGRKATVIMTTIMMSISCFIMANLPTYAEIGVAAAWIMTACRIFQGLSSMGEIIGADLYLTELVKPPIQYPVVATLESCFVLGGFAALGMASLVTSFGFNWRIAFWIGAGIALVGGFARTALRETPEFVDAKRQLTKTLEKANIDKKKIKDFSLYKESTNLKAVLAFFLTDCAWPLGFYLTYIYCGDILKNNFNYTSEQVIHQNLLVSVIELFGAFLLIYLSKKIYPLKILKIKLSVFVIFVIVCPYLFYKSTNPTHIFLIQSFIMLFGCFINPAFPIFYKHLPILKRFTYVSFSFAVSRAVMYVITSFSIIYLIEYFGYWGLLFILIPVTIGFGYGVNFFQKLEQEVGNYPEKLFEVHPKET
jgi:MFS family permease